MNAGSILPQQESIDALLSLTTAERVDRLIMAAEEGPLDKLKAILRVVSADAQTINGRTALMTALIHERVAQTLHLIPISDLSLRDAGGNTPAILAAYNGFIEGLRRVMAGCDVNARDDESATALMWAAANDNPDCVELLLTDARCDPTLVLGDCFYAQGAIFRHHLKLANKAAGVDIRAPDSGKDAFWLAAHCGHWACADLLAPYAEASLLNDVMAFAGRERFPRTIARQEAQALREVVGDAANGSPAGSLASSALSSANAAVRAASRL